MQILVVLSNQSNFTFLQFSEEMGDFTPAADEFCFRESTSFCSLHLKNVNEHLKAETVLVQQIWINFSGK